MQYLAVSEYEDYGLEAVTPEALVASASTLIDSICRRPSLGITQYSERVRVAPESGRARLTYLPLSVQSPATSPLISVSVRYGAGELSNDLAQNVAHAFGVSGCWVYIDPSQVEAVATTGEIILPTQVLGFRYLEAEVTYNAGFDIVPDAVKFACAQLVRNAQASPALNVRRSGLDRMQVEYFGPTLTDETVKRLLAPYVAVRCGA
jgi:hypothetical protein